MTELYDERITAMKALESHKWIAILSRDDLRDHRNVERLAAYRRKRTERQDTAQRIFWGPW